MCLVLFLVSHLLFLSPIRFLAGPIIVWVLSCDCWLRYLLIVLLRLLITKWRSKNTGALEHKLPSQCSLLRVRFNRCGCSLALGVESPRDSPVCHRVGELGRSLCWCLPYWMSTKHGILCICSALGCAQ